MLEKAFSENRFLQGKGKMARKRAVWGEGKMPGKGERQSSRFELTAQVPKDLSYSQALKAVEDQAMGEENILNRICRIEVSKYCPDPKRREFGLIMVNWTFKVAVKLDSRTSKDRIFMDLCLRSTAKRTGLTPLLHCLHTIFSNEWWYYYPGNTFLWWFPLCNITFSHFLFHFSHFRRPKKFGQNQARVWWS